MNASNFIYFQQMLTVVAKFSDGYVGPSYSRLRTTLIDDVKKELQLLVDTYMKTWQECGCTIMGDGWKDVSQRPLINFLVYCPRGICFIKSVDA